MPEDEFELLDDNTEEVKTSGRKSPNEKSNDIKGRQINKLKRENVDEVKFKKKSKNISNIGQNSDTGEKSLEKAKSKRMQLNNSLTRKVTSESDDDSIEDKNSNNKDGDNKEKKDKNPVNKIKNKFENARNTMSSPEQLVKATVKKTTKATVKLVATLLSPIIIGLLLVILVVYFILGPLMEVWNSIDEGATYVANSVEKFTNFYKGFGYQDSKAAFFDEVNELQEVYYNNQLNLPLLMSTLFYTETDGYDTEYGEVEESKDGDPISSLASGGVSNLLSFFRTWTKEKIKEASDTVDENGLTYNAGKIYRLRRLAAAMCDRNGPSTTVSLDKFADMYGGMFAKAIKDVFSSVIGALGEVIEDGIDLILNDVIDIVTFNWDNLSNNTQDFVDSITNSGQNVKHCLGILLDVISFGLCSITKIKFSLTDGISVEYVPYTVNLEKYDDYLRDYYIASTPEFRQYLSGNEAYDKKKIEQIINNIHSNEKAFREIVLNEIEGTSESYAEGCVGAIDSDIISSLRNPIDVKNTNMTFDSNSAFGIVNGLKHNGVDLNSSNAGVNYGDNVYAIANGKVESVSESGGMSLSNIDNFLFIGDSRYAGISTKLKNYGSNVTVLGVVSSSPSDWTNVINNGSGMVLDKSITLPSDVSHVSIMLGVNNLSQDKELQDIINKLHERYRGAVIYVNSVYNTGKSYSGYATNDKIAEFNNKMKAFCESNSSYTKYIDVTTNLNESDGYLSSSYSADGLHLNEKGQDVLVGNIMGMLKNESNYESGGITLKLSHSLSINGKTYKFYSLYSNLDANSVALKKDNVVSSGDVIGKIGKTNAGVPQLHFEFRNESDSPIDPTNLFASCNSGVQLSGNTNEEKISNALLAAGFNYVQVASVMANIFFESGYDSTAINEIGCTGISQWCFERQENLTTYAKSKNIANTDLQTQITFLLAELKNEGEAVPYADTNGINIGVYKSVMNTIKDYKDINLATEYYCNNFEVPGEDLCAGRKNAGKGLEWYNRLLSQ